MDNQEVNQVMDDLTIYKLTSEKTDNLLHKGEAAKSCTGKET
jgi:hypothetical protein